MSYVKNTWSDGDVITATKINNIENGIAANDTKASQLQTDLDALEGTVDGELTNLKADLNDITEHVFNWMAITKDSSNVTILDGFVRSPDQTYPGRIDASTTRKCYYFRVTEDSYVYDVAAGSWSVVRISETEPTIGSDDEIALYFSGTHNVNNPLFVAAGNYITITSNAGTPNDATYVSPDAVGLKQTVGMTDAMKDEIATQKSLADYGNWSNGYWNTATTTRNDTYRAKCSQDIVFDKDTVLISYDALYIRGYIDGVSIDRKSALYVQANAVCHFFISRLVEDTTETINPVEFASAVKIVNEWPFDKYNLLHDSFYGLGMFRKIGVCGDSYSAVRLGYSWGQVLASELGVNVLNFAKSGDNSAMWIADTEHGLPLVLSSEKCDLYWIALGINDADTIVSNPSYLGSAADLSGGDYTQYPNTFWGNLGRIIESIQAYVPNAKIVMFKPIFGKVSTALAPTNVTNLPAIRNTIGEIAAYYNIPVIDSLDDIFYRSPDYADHMDYDISAGNHPSILLYPGIAHANMRLFSRCVAEYDSYFMGIDYSS